MEETNTVVEKKEKVLIPNITRGRMPAVVVYLVRCGDNRNESTKDLAKMFGTTVGKVDDIKKGRNFGYINDAFRPTAAQKDDGIAWLQRHHEFESGAVDKLIRELESLEVATEEEAAKFLESRKAARGQSEKTKTGEVADAGGGNRRSNPKKSKKAKSESETPEADADDLLA